MNEVVLTLDVDWAPDFVIDFVAGRLIDGGVRATWFVTHASPAVGRLRSRPDLFELGIHPNFLPGSSHGDEPAAVLDHCMALVPEATSMRTHGLAQSTSILAQVLARTPITADASLFLPRVENLRPFEYHWRGRTLLRVPYYWEDDLEMERPTPCWNLAPLLAGGAGLKVFDLHPIHVYLNSADMAPYEELKRAAPGGLGGASPAEAEGFVNAGEGTRSLFSELVDHLAGEGRSLCVRDLRPPADAAAAAGAPGGGAP